MAQIIMPKDGYNGLKAVQAQGRNEKCNCGSGKKVKYCCITETVYVCRDAKKKKMNEIGFNAEIINEDGTTTPIPSVK